MKEKIKERRAKGLCRRNDPMSGTSELNLQE